ncbi:transcriptional repressor EED/ESC/FIE [Dunaliella salina]|uniref:Transcriptional repressor EED/ESC/FIE n=1 Tax=Dunaliella salina TaxID=3046 RepID=A0ABQ7GIS0_DUNSA|nr:transcriptional repressor EED/ESC/FIE [Dunaliella salina]|eukprot:KAF5834487.1 transcriptional repressor EED/ESC/FIE [Dunaliella salina]
MGDGRPKFKFSGLIEEDHRAPIYCICFNEHPSYQDVFASVGHNRATVYRCLHDHKFEELQVYIDADKEERFFVCKWTLHAGSSNPLLLVAGLKGIVRVVDCITLTLVHTFAGHGNSINDIALLPGQPSLFLTASKDEAIRLWNLKTKCCVLIISGEGGHSNEVLTLACHPWSPHRFLSGGMDNMVKIWSLEEHASVIEASFAWQSKTRTFPTKMLHFPRFSSDQVHANYVDCVRWLGDLCLSKSVDDRILLWKPVEEEGPACTAARGTNSRVLAQCKTFSTFVILQEFHLPDSHVWFVRFSLDMSQSLLACGNRTGKVFLWNPSKVPANLLHELKATQSRRVIRQTAVSRDAQIVLASNEDGCIFRWDAGGMHVWPSLA